MTPGEALHTAARQRCEDRFWYWAEMYAVMASEGRDRRGALYTPEALRVFPRYNMARAIRLAIERFEPSAFVDVEVTRSVLAEAASSAHDDFTSSPIGRIDAQSMNEELRDFLEFVRSLKVTDLIHVQPLPYRRVLDPQESERCWAAIRQAWSISTGYWYPLVNTTSPVVEAYDADDFAANVPLADLRERLRRQGVLRVWELKEYGPEFEEAIDLFEPAYDGAEGYWSSERLDWIVYASHEGSVTVGGSLLAVVREVWPQYAAHLWKPWTA